MEKYSNFIVRRKKQLIILLIIISLFSFLGVLKIRLNTDFSMFSEEGTIYEERLNDIEEVFGELNQIVILVNHPVFDDTTLTNLRNIQESIEAMDNVTNVQGVAPQTISIDGNSIPIENISANTLESYYTNFEEFSPLVKIDNSYYSSFTVFITKDFSKDDINAIENILDETSYDSYISGDSYNQLKIGDYIIKILLTLPPLTILIILIVFRWQMGALKPALLSILPAGMGSLWTFGIIGWLGNEISILTAIVPIFIIVIGSADGLHFTSHFQDLKKAKKDDITALNETLRIVGIPMIVTTLTSMLGFLSLLSMRTDSIHDLAIFSTLGIFLAGVATWYVLPLLFSNGIDMVPKKASKHEIDLSKYLKKLIGLPITLIILAIIIISSFAYSNINNEFNMLMIYKDYTVVSKNAEKINEVNGGSIPIFITIDLQDSATSLSSMDKINEFSDSLLAMDEVNKVVNPYALFQIAYKNISNTYDIPTDAALNNLYNSFAVDDSSIINGLISIDDNIVRLLVFPKDLNNDTLSAIELESNQANIDAKVTGVQYLMKDLNESISNMQIISISIALSAVFLMLVITLRSIKIAFYSLLPIIITVIAIYGFLGISSIPLNITTVIIFSITIGVGIDYAVHFSSVYKYYLHKNNSNSSAIELAYKNTARPIIANAIGITLGLSILMVSPLTIHLNVSLLMWVSMTVSVITTLALLPLLFSFNKNQQ